VSLEQWGAFAFGAVLGWFVYFTNRYRKGEAQFSDLTSLLGIVGGGGITALFGEGRSALFAAYGLGLASGFFAYFFVLIVLVLCSPGQFSMAWFLDGRRKRLPIDEEIPPDTRTSTAPMSVRLGAARDRASAYEFNAAPVAAGELSPLEAVAAERTAAISAIYHAIQKLIKQQGQTKDNAEREALRNLQIALTDAMQDLLAVRLRDRLLDPRVATALAELKQITKAMQTEAAAMKQASETFAKATQILQKAGKVIGLVTGIFA
jgi:hypothetical protein